MIEIFNLQQSTSRSMKTSTLSSKVNILLSTYNGISFIQEQLDSLQHQDYPNISIYIRDDGSTDGTINFLQKYQEQFSNIKLILGENIGYINSFITLAREVEIREGDLYAFCDQDDVWSPQKISRSIEMIQKSADPSMTLYFSRINLVDNDLNFVGLSPVPKRIGFGNAIVDCTPSGCSIVVGSGIQALLIQGKPEDMFGHDWWAYLVATAFGDVIYDIEPQIQYRKHSFNTSIGYLLMADPLFRIKFFTKDLIQRWIQDRSIVDFLSQSKKFLMTYDSIPLDKKMIVKELLQLRRSSSWSKRFRYILNPKIHRDGLVEDLILKLSILLGCH